MGVIDFQRDGELRNGNEDLVWEALEARLAADPRLCRCRDCVLDAAAIALNRLPPRYRVFGLHEHARAEDAAARRAEAAAAVAAACQLVVKRPHHC